MNTHYDVCSYLQDKQLKVLLPNQMGLRGTCFCVKYFIKDFRYLTYPDQPTCHATKGRPSLSLRVFLYIIFTNAAHLIINCSLS